MSESAKAAIVPEAHIAAPTEFDAGDRAALREYLARNPRFIRSLARKVPEIAGSSIEELSLTASRHRGFEDAIKAIGSMALDDSQESSSFI